MEATTRKVREASRTNHVILFVAHQLVATLGVLVVAPYVTNFFRDVLSAFGWVIQKNEVSWILTETPYFPMQLFLAFSLGWLLGRHFRHRSMLWVWILPLVILISVVVAFPAIGQLALARYASLSSPSRLSHFFGWGCQPKNRCLDQVVITLPFYSAAAYSLGATVARKLGGPDYIKEFIERVNLKRTVVFVGVPYYCCELVSNFNYVRGLAFSQTWVGLSLYFGIALLESAVVTFLFVALTGLVCRLLFLKESEKASFRGQETDLAQS
jgi:hypothetical protein